MQTALFTFDFVTLLGGQETTIPCCSLGDIMPGPETNDWQTSIQTDDIIASPWQHHQGRGNATKTFGFTVLRSYPTRAQAELYAHDREHLLNTSQTGHALYRYGWHEGIPISSERWQATVQRCRALPISSDQYAGIRRRYGQTCGAWIAVEYAFLLTHRTII
ncbi:hypothetical protein [Akkermansia glycaniphila]|uniref:Uncharacterized protein n=1 Tax=Akkermansia glycaniphila TaxID=1679444 RepID=A0A1C7PFG4_9BACT|nr:hypothetical protein [Akkermansia glycaniphila]OCA02326.1 hypothetical protein AC781_10870 [Akkermansia glycaniphila]OCA04188.1 hypothetical protein AC781_00400 [Akkermansia glycaniphila]SEH87710.1 Hypothetical protein PYTT_1394 [Akkermansia glycaniphila]